MNKRLSLVAGLLAAMTLIQTGAICSESQPAAVKLHLPREVSVKDKNIRLGDIAVVSGDASLVKAVEGVAIGTMSKPGQAVTFERQTIMTRLGCDGVNMSLVTMTGADKVTVTLVRSSISSAELLGTAERFASQTPIPADQRLHAMDMPADVNLAANGGKLDIVPSMVGKPGDNPFTVKLSVNRDGKTVVVREVRFVQVPRNVRTTVAASAPMVKKPAVAVDAPKVVFRNQPVVIEIESQYLKVTAMGLPLEDGRAGQLIKVRNLDSKRDIIAKVRPDGTVSPVL